MNAVHDDPQDIRMFRSVFGKEGHSIEEVEPERGFETEREMQTLIEKNISVVFPNHKFIRSEFPIGNKRIDTVVFDTMTNSFVLIEYKNVMSKGVLEQAAAYLKQLELQGPAFVLAYNETTSPALKKSDVVWDKSRMVVVAPSFTSDQRDLATLLNVQLYQIIRYKSGIMMISGVTKQKNGADGEEPKDAEKKYLKKWGSNVTVPLYDELKNALCQQIPDAKIQTTKYYIKCVSSGKIVCTVQVLKKSIKLCYNTSSLHIARDDKDFIMHLIKDGKPIGKAGLGDYSSKIKNDKDVARAIPYVRATYATKVKRYVE